MIRTRDHSYREGKPDAPILLLSVAGRHEERERRPAAGPAKRHLTEILTRLRGPAPDLAPYADADDYPILNANAGIEYKAKTGRTEPLLSENLTAKNLQRIRDHVAGRPVLAFGMMALRTATAAGIESTMHGRHPSSLNRIRNSEVPAPTAAERQAKRYDLAASVMLETRCTTTTTRKDSGRR